jgi:hypothetical protein
MPISAVEIRSAVSSPKRNKLMTEVAVAEAADRLALRQREALPRLQSLQEWLKIERLRTANGSGLARAIDYTLKRWPAIMRYVLRGDIRLQAMPAQPPGFVHKPA